MCYSLSMKPAIAYYRVSTVKQGQSGLGLEAQRAAVAEYAAAHGFEVVEEFTEVETGTAKRQRVAIFEAIEATKAHGGTLLIAKLDRLARNVHFISGLIETKVNFKAVDMPEVDTFTLHVLAAVAEQEAKAISARTKAALQAAKRKGTVLGAQKGTDHFGEAGRSTSAATRAKAARKAYSRLLVQTVKQLKADGHSLRAIAARLNDLGETTREGAEFSAVHVSRILKRESVA